MAGEADIVSSVSASACHIGGPIGANPGELALVYVSEKQNTDPTDDSFCSEKRKFELVSTPALTRRRLLVWLQVFYC